MSDELKIGKYIDPFTDFGFKRLFGQEPSKEILIDFLNELLSPEKRIETLEYKQTEKTPHRAEDRKAIFDLYCKNERGDHFIVELQKVKQEYFLDRSVFYSTFPIQEQAVQGKWNYQLDEVYTIGILDFNFNDKPKYLHEAKLLDIDTKEVFYDKLSYIFIQIPKFNKQEEELETHFDKWLYLLKNLNTFHEMPSVLQEHVFRKVFDMAEVSNLTDEEMDQYQQSLKVQRDNDAIMLSNKRETLKEVALSMKQKGYGWKEISEITGLKKEEIQKL